MPAKKIDSTTLICARPPGKWPTSVARQAHQPVGDAADVHQVRGQQEERHRQQDERVVGVEGLLHQRHRRQARLDDQDRQAGEAEREGDRHAQHHQREEHAEQDQARGAGGEDARRSSRFRVQLSSCLRGGDACHQRCAGCRTSARRGTASRSAPASGQAMWISHSGSSASSEMRFQREARELDSPHQTNTSAKTRTNTLGHQRAAPRRRAAEPRPDVDLEMRALADAEHGADHDRSRRSRKRAISSVQM